MPVYIQDFEVEAAQADLDVTELDAEFEDAFAQLWRGGAENDGFNRLILAAGLTWRQVAMLRGYCKYLLQVGVPFSQSYVEGTFARYPLLVRLLVELFEARFDPSTGSESKAEIKAGIDKFTRQLQALAGGDAATIAALQPVIEARNQGRNSQYDITRSVLKSLLDRVASLDEDRILRSFINTIDATLRTGYYQTTQDGKPKDYIGFKFDSAKVPDLPKPRPYREIFVYSPRVEGVHLRFGPVARGGLRWSDRREDFRTEVLGLVKAQMVKNTVIVPVGSKGGFFVKRPPPGGDRDAQLAEGIACYKMFINGLLDITDNLVGGKVVPPRDVVRHDQDDPYLVVAADKGTATFSDIANGIAARTWLLARRCVRVGRFGRLRPQGHGHHRQGRMGVGQAPFPRHGPRLPEAGLHRGRRRRHVRRRVRQRHAAVEAHPPAGGVRSSPHLPRPESGCRGVVQGTRAHVQAAAFELGGLQQDADQQGRRHLPAQRQVDSGVGRKRAPRSASRPASPR